MTSSITPETSPLSLKISQTASITGTPPGRFPLERPLGYFGSDADPAAIKDFYDANGYLVMEDAFSPEEVDALIAESTGICRGQRGQIANMEPLPDSLTDDEVLRRFLCIHFPHKISELLLGTLFNPATLKVLTTVVSPNVKCMQSMLFIKPGVDPIFRPAGA